MSDVSLVEPALVWGLFVRGLAAIFVFAHLSLLPQLIAVCGARSVTSIAERLGATRRAFPGWRRFVDAPTLLWLGASDTLLRVWCTLGLVGGLCGVWGGPVGTVGLAVAWITYLSLADAAGLTFPWDTLLLECGFLIVFLPATLPLVGTDRTGLQLALVAPPGQIVSFAFLFLTARLMLGFAKVKFIGTKTGDELYLQSFFVWLPVPNPLGWYLHHAPAWFHRVALRFMFVAEVVAPILLLIPGAPRLLGCAARDADVGHPRHRELGLFQYRVRVAVLDGV